jgi:hypothetical protein
MTDPTPMKTLIILPLLLLLHVYGHSQGITTVGVYAGTIVIQPYTKDARPSMVGGFGFSSHTNPNNRLILAGQAKIFRGTFFDEEFRQVSSVLGAFSIEKCFNQKLTFGVGGGLSGFYVYAKPTASTTYTDLPHYSQWKNFFYCIRGKWDIQKRWVLEWQWSNSIFKTISHTQVEVGLSYKLRSI